MLRPLDKASGLCHDHGHHLRGHDLALRAPHGVGHGSSGYANPLDPMAKVGLGAVLWYNSLAAVGTAGIGLTLFFVLLRKTKLGGHARDSERPRDLIGLGIPVGKIFALTWFTPDVRRARGSLACSRGASMWRARLCCLEGIPRSSWAAWSRLGAVVAGVTLGILEVMAQGYLNPLMGQFGQNFHEVFPYLIMILVLVVRPYGLFGQKTVRGSDADSPARHLLRAGHEALPDRWHHLGIVVFALILVALPFVANSYWLTIANDTLVTVVAAVAMMILTGYTGQISLGHAAFIALGAYTAGILGGCTCPSVGDPCWPRRRERRGSWSAPSRSASRGSTCAS